jgi:diadenosine tetraphosphate (Ap4A) HIT family hydrolase
MRTVDKTEALELLEQNRRELLGDEDGCVMCALTRRAPRSAELVAESRHGVVLLDRFATREGHLLVLSREHCEDTLELGWARYQELQELAYRGVQTVTRTLRPLRVFVAVLGASVPLPMSFPHFHIHVLPVYDADERARPAHVLSWSAGVLIYEEEEARTLAARLRDAWPSAVSE